MRFMSAFLTFQLASGLPALLDARDAPFLRGDVNSNGSFTVSDPILILRFLFSEAPAGIACMDAADVNDDGRVDVTDAARLLNYLFLHDAPPSSPFPEADLDPTSDDLGCDLAGDAFIHVIDRSGSMQDEGELTIARRDVRKNIEYSSPTVLFAVVFVDKGVLTYPAGGAPTYAAPKARTEALQFVQTTPGGSGSCVKEGLLAALDFAEGADATRKVVIFYSDGGTDCPGSDAAAYGRETLDEVTARNTQGVQINAIGVGHSVEEQFLMQLAARNHGAYARVVQ